LNFLGVNWGEIIVPLRLCKVKFGNEFVVSDVKPFERGFTSRVFSAWAAIAGCGGFIYEPSQYFSIAKG
jgi:hypothetical protein